MPAQKQGPAKTYGPRYGLKVRRRVDSILRMQKALYRCPRCGSLSVKRVSAGIWQCKKCGFKFAAKAYRVV